MTADAEAIYQEVARLLKDPESTEDQRKTSFSKLLELAQNDHLPSIAAVGYLFQTGNGTPRNEKEAALWLRKAAERNHAVSMFNLAEMLVNDRLPLENGEKDRTRQYAEGVEWLRKASEAGLDRARFSYGLVLMTGDFGAKSDPKKAAGLLGSLAKEGNLDASNALGTLYEIGNGVPYSPSEAEKCFRTAAEKGHLKARTNLSRVLDPHSTDKGRRTEAIAWLILAEQDGDVAGRKILSVKMPSFSAEDLAAARKKAVEIRKLISKPVLPERLHVPSETQAPGATKPE